jgi:hypothetical protein
METALHLPSRGVGTGQDAHVIVSQPEDLAEIYREGVNLCVWRRTSSPAMSEWLGAISARHTLSLVQRVDAEQVDLRAMLAELPEGPEREAWVEDLHFVVRLYADLLEARWLGVRLTTLDREMCPRFHVDRVGVRLLCTYAGPATEWVENADVERGSLGATGREVLRPGRRIQRLGRFDVALLKGEAWPGNTGNGAVHRSPAVRAGQCRIMLSIDGVD